MSQGMSIVHTRTSPPHQLGTNETLNILIRWRAIFRTFHKRPFGPWNPNWAIGRMKVDLVHLLYTLPGYLSHPYLTDKTVLETRGWRDVWDIICEHYGFKVTNETFF